MTEQVDQSKIADDYSKIWNVLSQIDVSKHVETVFRTCLGRMHGEC